MLSLCILKKDKKKETGFLLELNIFFPCKTVSYRLFILLGKTNARKGSSATSVHAERLELK